MKRCIVLLGLIGCAGTNPAAVAPAVGGNAVSSGNEAPATAPPPQAAREGHPVAYSPEDYAKNYALSACISRAFPGDDAVKKEAGAAGAGYFELGSFPVEAQGELIALAEQFLARKYESHLSDQSLAVMKCIDMYRSAELDALAHKVAHESSPE